LDKQERYFDVEQEEAVVAYLSSTNQKERNSIYNKSLEKPFNTMVESIIRTYNLFSSTMSYDELFVDTLSFLHEKLDKFQSEKEITFFKLGNCDTSVEVFKKSWDEAKNIKISTKNGDLKFTIKYKSKSKIIEVVEPFMELKTSRIHSIIFNPIDFEGSISFYSIMKYKAYSYYSTIIKRRLIHIRKQEQANKKKTLLLEDSFSQFSNFTYINGDCESTTGSFLDKFFYEIKDVIKVKMQDEKYLSTLKEPSIIVGKSILEIMDNWVKLYDKNTSSNKFKKNSLLESLRNLTNMDTKTIRKALKPFKDLYLLEKKRKIKDMDKLI